ncbi:MAG TPA: TonB-dependent receptor, partial [Verrucomicrobiales bacterium]|nr:TonB-dependent receptor [Verrucomicrobiales bacterium]
PLPLTARNKPEAHPAPEALPDLVVEGKAASLLGIAPSASKGQSSAEELAQRPFLRRGELLEVVPGVIVTQHAGGGKANQYFLRGFNLDHGTDFGVFVDGMPVNMRTHAHGQGYADLNILIPEMVEQLDYRKGPYFADFGDLTAAGAARFRLWDALPQGMATLEFGEHDYVRAFFADSIQLSTPSTVTSSGKDGKSTTSAVSPTSILTYGLEYNYYNGPWDLAEHSRKWNGVLRYVWKDVDERFSITAMGYDGTWRSSDQVASRAIDRGIIDRFGNLDATNGGRSSRYSLMAEWEKKTADGGKWHADVWGGYYDLKLFSNFTGFLDDPVRGDQFEQSESRWQAGGTVRRDWEFQLGSAKEKSTFSAGVDTRHDIIDDIGLYKTTARVRHDTVRVDDVYEGSAGVFALADLRVNDWFRVQPGLRADWFRFHTSGAVAGNAGTVSAGLVSPKLSFIFGPWAQTEFYVNGGIGFHSNDARGVLTRLDPVSGDIVSPVDPLVRIYGVEAGVRTEAMSHWVHTLSLWYQKSDSELVYIGDAGTNEAGPGSTRYGLELSSYWRPNDWFTFDSEFTLTHGEFDEGQDTDIPNSVPVSWSGGITLGKAEGLFGSVRGRFFGKRPLEESGGIKSKVSFEVNAKAGYRKNNWEVAVECLNIFNRANNDIEYYYTSRLPGEPLAGFDDIHLHPSEPRSFRVMVTRRF